MDFDRPKETKILEPNKTSISGTKQQNQPKPKEEPPEHGTSQPTRTKDRNNGTRTSRPIKVKGRPPILQQKDEVVTLKQFLELKTKAREKKVLTDSMKTFSAADLRITGEDDIGEKSTGENSATKLGENKFSDMKQLLENAT